MVLNCGENCKCQNIHFNVVYVINLLFKQRGHACVDQNFWCYIRPVSIAHFNALFLKQIC